MSDNFLTKLCASITLLVPLTQFAAGSLARSLSYNPAVVDHSDPATLLAIYDAMQMSLYGSILGLVGPTLALAASFGWAVVLRPAGPQAKLGVHIFQAGMVLVVLQDAIQLYADATLPAQFAVADASVQSALLEQGAGFKLAINLITELGHAISIVGVALYGLALLRLPGTWKALGGLAMLVSAAMLVSLVVTLTAPAVAFPALLTAVLLQVVWVMVLGVMMLHWRSGSAPQLAA